MAETKSLPTSTPRLKPTSGTIIPNRPESIPNSRSASAKPSPCTNPKENAISLRHCDESPRNRSVHLLLNPQKQLIGFAESRARGSGTCLVSEGGQERRKKGLH